MYVAVVFIDQISYAMGTKNPSKKQLSITLNPLLIEVVGARQADTWYRYKG